MEHYNRFLVLLKSALTRERLPEECGGGKIEEWEHIYKTAARQGVLAVVYEAVSRLPDTQRPPRKLNLQWALSVDAIENRYKLQYERARQLSELWGDAGIKTAVLKGMSVSRYYPVPEHRECGDFDCYLFGAYARGNEVAEAAGASVDTRWYKHAQILFNGLAVENHKFFVTVRGYKEKKAFERRLENYIEKADENEMVPGTNIIIPPVMFTALFLTYHSLAHFLTEGIRMRHLCDWACFLEREQQRVDWAEFYSVCEEYHFRRFADAVTAIAVKYLGAKIENPEITTESPYAEVILASVFDDDALIYSTGKGKWWGRFKLLSNISRYRWKYREIYQKSYFGEMMRLVAGFVFDRNPKV